MQQTYQNRNKSLEYGKNGMLTIQEDEIIKIKKPQVDKLNEIKRQFSAEAKLDIPVKREMGEY